MCKDRALAIATDVLRSITSAAGLYPNGDLANGSHSVFLLFEIDLPELVALPFAKPYQGERNAPCASVHRSTEKGFALCSHMCMFRVPCAGLRDRRFGFCS